MYLSNSSKLGNHYIWVPTSDVESAKRVRKVEEDNEKLSDEFIRNKRRTAFTLIELISYNEVTKIATCRDAEGLDLSSDITESRDNKFETKLVNVMKADSKFGLKDNSQLRNLNIGNVLANMKYCYELLQDNSYKNGVSDFKDEVDCLKYPMYTFAGGILLAVNPYKFYDIYNNDIADEFVGKNIVNMEPHPFAVTEWSYRRMLKDKKSQSIVISGESGAGKTETSKHVLKYLSYLSNKRRMYNYKKNGIIKNNNPLVSECTILNLNDLRVSSIEDCLLSSNPLLEIFGNAKTIRNDNSSRFGKYMKLEFSDDGYILNSSINTYLLAKSRVVHIPQGERNYHIFYLLLRNMNQEQRIKWLSIPDNMEYDGIINSFNYLKSKNGILNNNNVDKHIKYNIDTINKCFESIGISNNIVNIIYDLVMGILLLGNVEFKKNEEDDYCDITNETFEICSKVSNLFGIPDSKRLIKILTRRNIINIERKLSYSEAIYTRDSIARYLYQWIFDLVVDLINIALNQEITNKYRNNIVTNNINDVNDSTETELISKVLSIGILDIFGFEDLSPNYPNSFEQLCINYCNERLHSFFLEQLLYRDHLLYKAEGLGEFKSTDTSFDVSELLFHQSLVCTIISGTVPKYTSDYKDSKGSNINFSSVNIISILDETCKVPIKGNRDEIFCQKVHQLKNINGQSYISSCNNGIHKRKSVITSSSQINETSQVLSFISAVNNVIIPQKLNLNKTFTICHFAGPVQYQCDGFTSKNTDFLSNDIERYLLTNMKSIINLQAIRKKLYNKNNIVDNLKVNGRSDISTDETNSTLDVLKSTGLIMDNKEEKGKFKSKLMISNTNISNLSDTSFIQPLNTNKNKSVGTTFIKQMQNMLTEELYPTQSHFIRCIKPNDEQEPLKFDDIKVYQQLQIGGILQVLNIMIYGYPCRIPYLNIYNYFKQMIDNKLVGNDSKLSERNELKPNINIESPLDNSSKDIDKKVAIILSDQRLFVSLLLDYMGYKDGKDYKLGLTRIFFKYNVLDKIEEFISKCKSESSEWKINCVLEIYNYWIRRRSHNYWILIKSCVNILGKYKEILYKKKKQKERKAMIIICNSIYRYIQQKKEKKRKQEEQLRLKLLEEKKKQEMEIEKIKLQEEQEITNKYERGKNLLLRNNESNQIKQKENQDNIYCKVNDLQGKFTGTQVNLMEHSEIKNKLEIKKLEDSEQKSCLISIHVGINTRVLKKNNQNLIINNKPNEVFNRSKRTRTEFIDDSLDLEFEIYKAKRIKYNISDLSNKKDINFNDKSINIQFRSEDEDKQTKIDSENIQIYNENNYNKEFDSPLLCTSAMRVHNKYSSYFVTSNSSVSQDTLEIDYRSLQDELVEAEFIDDILSREELQVINNNNNDTENSKWKTSLRRPTIFVPIRGENKLAPCKGTSLIEDDLSIKAIKSDHEIKSLIDLQKIFRNNISNMKFRNNEDQNKENYIDNQSTLMDI
ncbi:myosin head family protein [Cryptosporidium andersoni]|uniref:Myosin head family protein n=1 Tax=Cryptosporidium andersoni TaxID=117008 RepID=A0A1J4MQV8_9CRYT|nr:myosin head family protein [Cryptosporidium andersoni]